MEREEALKLSHGSILDRLRSDAFFQGMKSHEVKALVDALEGAEICLCAPVYIGILAHVKEALSQYREAIKP